MLTDARIQQIEQAIAEAEAQGQPWTNQSIFHVVGGHYAGLSQYLKARRAQAHEAVAAGVALEDPPALSPPSVPDRSPPPPPAPAPLLEAQAAFETARRAAWDAGVEHGRSKTHLKTLAEDLGKLERQQRATTHDPTIADLDGRLAALRDEYPTVQTRCEAIHQRRRQLENRAMALRDRASTLGTQAWAAQQAWQEATATLASDASAYDKYQARAAQGGARQALEALVGEGEAAAILDRGEDRPWLRG